MRAVRAKTSERTAGDADRAEIAGETSNDAVEPDAAAGYTSRRPTPGDEQAAVDLVRRKLRAMPADLDRAKATRRLVDMLARRGYSAATAFAVVKAELAAADS
ncbi:RecX family transcriptional regulator [Nocardia sp. PE-7]|nr:RecX family transcriptional regulator [Nocardia sp. PE-7]WKG13318.1 RecX family transcriptional regulator [Nocardia sp. PE-7]